MSLERRRAKCSMLGGRRELRHSVVGSYLCHRCSGCALRLPTATPGRMPSTCGRGAAGRRQDPSTPASGRKACGPGEAGCGSSQSKATPSRWRRATSGIGVSLCPTAGQPHQRPPVRPCLGMASAAGRQPSEAEQRHQHCLGAAASDRCGPEPAAVRRTPSKNATGWGGGARDIRNARHLPV